MRRGVWMGTTDYATWVPAPSISGYGASLVGWSSKSSYLNGGAGVRRSRGSHREFMMTWSNKSQGELAPIHDLANGLLGSGLIYWSDPFAEVTNIFPPQWATPVLAAEGSDVVNIGGGTRPAAVPTGPSAYGFPVQSAQFGQVVNARVKRCVILIPPGRDLVFRAFGQDGTGSIRYHYSQPGQTNKVMAWTSIDALNNPATLSRASGGATGSYIEVFLSASAGTATATITGLMGQIVPTGATPTWQRFYSGRGNSGCEFEGMPQETPYSVPLDMVGMSAVLVETGAWR